MKIRTRRKGTPNDFSLYTSSNLEFKVHQEHSPAYFEKSTIQIGTRIFTSTRRAWFLLDKLFGFTR